MKELPRFFDLSDKLPSVEDFLVKSELLNLKNGNRELSGQQARKLRLV
jgi:hypothetical protein